MTHAPVPGISPAPPARDPFPYIPYNANIRNAHSRHCGCFSFY